jgi:alkylhydroperoxidase family enzyme
MAWIRTISEDEADPELRSLYERMLDPVSGRVDHILTIHSLHQKGLEGHHSVYKAVMTSTHTLRKAEREMIALVVSTINNCHY